MKFWNLGMFKWHPDFYGDTPPHHTYVKTLQQLNFDDLITTLHDSNCDSSDESSLSSYFSDANSIDSSFVPKSLENISNFCYQNSLLQLLASTDTFLDSLVCIYTSPPWLHALIKLLRNLRHGDNLNKKKSRRLRTFQWWITRRRLRISDCNFGGFFGILKWNSVSFSWYHIHNLFALLSNKSMWNRGSTSGSKFAPLHRHILCDDP